MPRVKASPKKCVKPANPQSSNNWVFLLKGEAFEVPEGYQGSGTPDVVQLRHPQTGAPAMFLFSPGDNLIQEVLTFSENKRSWFIEDSVKSDGKMHLSTPVDPIFLVLPYLRKSQHACPLDQILKDDEFPETERLLSCAGLKHLSQVADKKGDEDLNAYKYNEEKALAWLARKTERVCEVLKQKGIHVSTNNAVSATFVKSNQDSAESYLRYAHGVVSEYLEDDLSAKLSKHLGLPEPEPGTNKRKQLASANTNATADNSSSKRPKAEPQEPVKNGALDLSKPEKVPKTSITAKDKARAKSAAGSKNISSFFKKK